MTIPTDGRIDLDALAELAQRLRDVNGWLAALDYPGVGTAMATCEDGANALDNFIDLARRAAIPSEQGEAVGEAVILAGLENSTYAVFQAAKVPAGTKLYDHPASAQQETVAVSLAKQTKADLVAAHEEICKLQGLDPATHSWPVWSSPAHTIEWCDRIIAGAYPAPAAGVKVKALEWVRPNDDRSLSRAESAFGTYRVWTHAEAAEKWFWRLSDAPFGARPSGTVDNELVAKAAAQADYEARILSALDQGEPK